MHKVLLAVDGSARSKDAARLLSRMPHSDSLQLVILTVVQRPFVHHSYTTSELLEATYQSDKRKAEQVYGDIAKLFDGANVDVRHETRDGNIGQAIVDTADEINCDLIVLGAKGHSQIHRVLLGSVSDYVSTHSPCSVLVVRNANDDALKTQAESTEAQGKMPLRIVVGCDGSEPSVAGLQEIAEIPWGSGVETHLLAVAPFLYDFFGELSSNSEVSSHFESVLESAKEQLSQSTPDLHTHLLEREHVGEGIVQFVEQIKGDLIVIGETPRSTLSRLLMGSVSRYVLRHVHCSVWIARNRAVSVSDDKKRESEESGV